MNPNYIKYAGIFVVSAVITGITAVKISEEMKFEEAKATSPEAIKKDVNQIIVKSVRILSGSERIKYLQTQSEFWNIVTQK